MPAELANREYVAALGRIVYYWGYPAIFTNGSAQAASTCWSVPIGKERNQPSFLASCGCRPMCPGLPVAALRHTPPNRSPNHSGAAKRGECDVAPIHIMDPETGEYNRPFLTEELELLAGYRRLQGIVFRNGDHRFEGRSLEEAVAVALAEVDCLMVGRNAGSGTRILIDRLLKGSRPPGYWSQPKSHNAVAAAVAQSRADWGVTIDSVARRYGLGFIPLQDEHYDFVVPKTRLSRPAVEKFRTVLDNPSLRATLAQAGFTLAPA